MRLPLSWTFSAAGRCDVLGSRHIGCTGSSASFNQIMHVFLQEEIARSSQSVESIHSSHDNKHIDDPTDLEG